MNNYLPFLILGDRGVDAFIAPVQDGIIKFYKADRTTEIGSIDTTTGTLSFNNISAEIDDKLSAITPTEETAGVLPINNTRGIKVLEIDTVSSRIVLNCIRFGAFVDGVIIDYGAYIKYDEASGFLVASQGAEEFPIIGETTSTKFVKYIEDYRRASNGMLSGIYTNSTDPVEKRIVKNMLFQMVKQYAAPGDEITLYASSILAVYQRITDYVITDPGYELFIQFEGATKLKDIVDSATSNHELRLVGETTTYEFTGIADVGDGIKINSIACVLEGTEDLDALVVKINTALGYSGASNNAGTLVVTVQDGVYEKLLTEGAGVVNTTITDNSYTFAPTTIGAFPSATPPAYRQVFLTPAAAQGLTIGRNNIGNYLSLAISPIVTLDFFVYLQRDSQQTLVTEYNGESSLWYLRFNSSNKLQITVPNVDPENNQYIQTDNEFSTGWHQIAIKIESILSDNIYESNFTLIIDGAEESCSITGSTATFPDTVVPDFVEFGGDGSTGVYFDLIRAAYEDIHPVVPFDPLTESYMSGVTYPQFLLLDSTDYDVETQDLMKDTVYKTYTIKNGLIGGTGYNDLVIQYI